MDSQNIDWKTILPSIYQDLAQPAIKKIGTALSSIIGIVVFPAGASAKILETNMEKLVKRIEKIEPEKIQPVVPEIGIPILERLKFTRGQELVELYVELFVKSCNSEKQDQAHPSYFEIITNLAVDEAKIIDFLSKEGIDLVPYIKVVVETEGEGKAIVIKYLTNLSSKIKFYDPDSEISYLENLIRLGIVEDMKGSFLANTSIYSELMNDLRIERFRENVTEFKVDVNTPKGFLILTDFGNRFIKTCVLNKES